MNAKYDVLVVDDNEATRLLIARVLCEELPITVTLSASAEDAQRRADERRFDLILLDLLMPGTGGMHVLERVRREDGPNKTTPVVVVSVLGDAETVARCKSLGATHHVVKPILRESLTEVVRAHLAVAPKARVADSSRDQSPLA